MLFGQNPTAFAARLVVRRFDLRTRQVSSLPGSDGLWFAQWSPSGRYISALTGDSKLMLFDLAKNKWTQLTEVTANYPAWSYDSSYIYFDNYPAKESNISRVRIGDGRLENVASLKGVRRAQSFESPTPWMGLSPHDSPLVLRDIGSQEIYALRVEFP